MYNEEGRVLPEITVEELSNLLQNGNRFVLLDVREPFEVEMARLDDARVEYAPLSELAQHNVAALPEAAQDREANLVVLCHYGFRSAQVTIWLSHMGWKHVTNLAGGIDAYARLVDPGIQRY
jgi:rhodanese-related sulfurtransferase